MATELRSRSFRIEDEVWKAVQAHELSANQLLRQALGMPSKAIRLVAGELRDVTPESWKTGAPPVKGTITVGRAKKKSVAVNFNPSDSATEPLPLPENHGIGSAEQALDSQGRVRPHAMHSGVRPVPGCKQCEGMK